MTEELNNDEIDRKRDIDYHFQIGCCAFGYFLIIKCLENLCYKCNTPILYKREIKSYKRALDIFIEDNTKFPIEQGFKKALKDNFIRIHKERKAIFHALWAFTAEGYAAYHKQENQANTRYAARKFEDLATLENLSDNIIKWFEYYASITDFDLSLGQTLNDPKSYFKVMFETIGLFIINFSKIEALIELHYYKLCSSSPNQRILNEKNEKNRLSLILERGYIQNQHKIMGLFEELITMRNDIAHHFYVEKLNVDNINEAIQKCLDFVEYLTCMPGYEIAWVFYDDFDKKEILSKKYIFLPLTENSILLLMIRPFTNS
jgi:hypothetical protein